MFKKIVIASALALIASASFAQTAPGVYAGVDVGSTKISDDGDSVRDTSIGGFVGYNFNENFAVEGGYRSLFDKDGIEVSQTAISGLAIAPLSNGFSVYGRLGYNHLNAKNGESQNKALYGAGVSYAVTPTASVRFEVQKPHSDVTNMSVGVAFKF
jgi:OOP family OmpA-OmpF porin